jgi:microcompartment protein CcmL/EutN
MVLFRGDTSQVSNALRSGIMTAGATVVDTLFLPNAHPAIFTALDLSSETINGAALGIIETVTAASCIVASDAAAKSANVNLLELRLANGLGGKSFLIMEGEVADVETAVAAGIVRPTEDGLLVRKTVITHLAGQVRDKIV